MQKSIKLSYSVPINESGLINDEFLIGGTAISCTTTSNNHKFIAEELRESAQTLNGVPLLVDHRNEISAIKGRVKSGEYDEENSRINFKAIIKDSEIKKMIKDGLINSVSVGATVRDVEEIDEVLVPRGIVFKELSLVAVPADSNATFSVALKEAYSAQEKMKKCTECDKMIPEEKMGAHMEKMHPKKESQVQPVNTEVITTSQVSDKLKGGLKEMETQEKAEKSEMSQVTDMLKNFQEQLNAMKLETEKAKAETVKVQAEKLALEEKMNKHVEVSEKESSKYKIEQGFGALRGVSFTYVR